MIFEHGFSEYHPEYEKWRHYQVEKDTENQIERGFLFGEELWLVSNKGLVRFDTELRTQQHFFLLFWSIVI